MDDFAEVRALLEAYEAAVAQHAEAITNHSPQSWPLSFAANDAEDALCDNAPANIRALLDALDAGRAENERLRLQAFNAEDRAVVAREKLNVIRAEFMKLDDEMDNDPYRTPETEAKLHLNTLRAILVLVRNN